MEHPPTCKNVDKRWVNLDAIDEEDFLWDTFGTLDECTSCVYCDVRYFLTPTCIKFGALILCIAFCIAVSNLHRTTLNQEKYVQERPAGCLDRLLRQQIAKQTQVAVSAAAAAMTLSAKI